MELLGLVTANIETTITFQGHSITSDTVTIKVSELTHQYYADTDFHSGWGVNQEFVFTRTSNGWMLTSFELLNDGEILPTNHPHPHISRQDMIDALREQGVLP